MFYTVNSLLLYNSVCQNCDTGLQSRRWPRCGPLYRFQDTRPSHQPLKSTYTQWLRPRPEWRVSQVSHRLLKSGLCIDRGWSSILIARIIEWYLYFIFAESVASSYCERDDSRDWVHPRIGVLLCSCCDLWLKGSSWSQKLPSVIAEQLLSQGSEWSRNRKEQTQSLGEHTPRDPPPLNRLTFLHPITSSVVHSQLESLGG